MSDEEFVYESDHDVAPTHSKLIEAVAQLDKGQRIKKPARSEPTIEVSEFHLVKSGISNDDKDVIHVRDLAKNLGDKGFHREISKKLDGNRKKTKVLPKPLEKPAADRIKRSVGFEKTQTEIKKWNAVIERNRVADHVQFPLNRESFSFRPSTEFLKGFRMQSELQKELAALEPEKKEEEPEKPNKFAMTMAEIREKRKEAAKLRAMQSYKEAKAARQKRIKSKKFHRVQKKERVKTQLKEFEELQKTNPEAALEKLQLLDKSRALERMSLRHKGASQWARNKQIRAKYDKDTRQELAEQLSISRELTQKVRRSGDSEDDDADETVPVSISASDKENPWINGVKTQSEIDEFVSGYRKYWDEKHKEEDERSKTGAKTDVSKNNKMHEKENGDKQEEHQEPAKHEISDLERQISVEKVKRSRVSSVFNPVTEVITQYANNVTVNRNDNSTIGGFENKQINNRQVGKVKATKKKEKKVSFAMDVGRNELDNKENGAQTNNLDNVKIIDAKSNSGRSENEDVTTETNTLSSQLIRGNKTASTETNSPKSVDRQRKTNNKAAKRVSKQSVGTSAWDVETFDVNTEVKESTNDVDEPTMETIESSIKASESNIDAINDIFDDLEDRLRDKLQTKLEAVKEQSKKPVKKSKRKAAERQDNAEEDYSDGLKFKNKKQKPMMDEPMLEKVGDQVSDEEETNILKLNSLVNSISDAITKSQNKEAEIDPNKYINVKRQHLMTELPDIVTKGDEALDDSEGEEDERNHAIMSEAFAGDDVVEEFSKEKEEEIKKSQPKDIDLTMPGWGSWGGKNLKVSRRKRKRFIIKFPKDKPRKDENKGNVIVIEHSDTKLRQHQVTDLPYPFTSVKDFEASIRAPLGRTFVPENAHKRLIQPAIQTSIGKIIEPMSEEVLLKKNENSKYQLPHEKEQKSKKFQPNKFGHNKFPNRKFGNSSLPNRKFGNSNFPNRKFGNNKFPNKKLEGNKFQNRTFPSKTPQGGNAQE